MPADPPPEPGPPDDELNDALGRLSDPVPPGDVAAARAAVTARARRAAGRRRVVTIAAGVAAAAAVVAGVAYAIPDHDGGPTHVKTVDPVPTTTSTLPATTQTTQAAVTTTTAGTTTTTTGTTTSTTTTASAGGCTGGDATPPAGAVSKTVGDVDGDGKADLAWIAWGAKSPEVLVGIRTAAGGGSVTTFGSASPVLRWVLVADVDERGPTELLFDDGREVQLYAFTDCRIQPVLNPQGETYTFGLHGITGIGTGIGCIQTPSGRRLVGLNVESRNGQDTAWSSTEVDLDGLTARNGAKRSGTYTSPADDAKIALLEDVTCGDLTVQRDGVRLTP